MRPDILLRVVLRRLFSVRSAFSLATNSLNDDVDQKGEDIY